MLSDYQELVDDIVRDLSGETNETDRDAAIELAVSRFSTDRPSNACENVTAPGGKLLGLPPGWQASFSKLVSIDRYDGDEHYEHRGEVEMVPGVTRIRAEDSLSAGADYAVTYTVMHTVDEETDTIPLTDRHAVAAFAASILLEQLANQTAGQQETTISADAIDHRTKSQEYQSRANAQRKIYFNHMGLDPKRVRPASATADLSRTQGKMFRRR